MPVRDVTKVSHGAALAILGYLGAWSALAWVHLYRFTIPWCDNWCYLGPAAAAKRPFDLTAPLLGGFNGSGHVWGLHFPCEQLLFSVLFSAIGYRPAAGVALFVLLWMAVACLTAKLVKEFTKSHFWGLVAAALILSDRSVFNVAYGQRPEFIVALCVLAAWGSLSDAAPFRGRMRYASLCAAFFLMPLSHPVTLLIGPLLCIAAVAAGRRDPSAGGHLPMAATLSYCLGFAALFFWFYLQPDAWAQFRDHAAANRMPYSFGANLWATLQLYYYPTFTGHLLWLGAIIIGLSSIRGWASRRFGWPGPIEWGAIIVILSLLVQQDFINPTYVVLELPVAAGIVLLFVSRLQRSGRPVSESTLVRGAAIALVAVHGLFWANRTLIYIRSGEPDLRHELAAISTDLPRNARILIPDALWESALGQQERFSMATLPQKSTVRLRQAYEAYAFGSLSSGDMVVLDKFQTLQPLTTFPRPGWTHAFDRAHLLEGRKQWGYDLSVWVKN